MSKSKKITHILFPIEHDILEKLKAEAFGTKTFSSNLTENLNLIDKRGRILGKMELISESKKLSLDDYTTHNLAVDKATEYSSEADLNKGVVAIAYLAYLTAYKQAINDILNT